MKHQVFHSLSSEKYLDYSISGILWQTAVLRWLHKTYCENCMGRPNNYVPGTVRVRVYPRVRVGLGSTFEYGLGTGTDNGPILRVRIG